jgi:hypothetical protein
VDGLQYIRKASLKVVGKSGSGLDLSNLHFTFSIKKSDAQTPNAAVITIFNVAQDTALQIKKEFTRVIIQAGYEGLFGVIFDGNIRQSRIGRTSGTDTFVEISAGDGDQATISAVVNTTIAASQTTQANIIAASTNSMQPYNVTVGYVAPTGNTKLPRGKSMFGMATDHLRRSAETIGATWSVQDGKFQMVPRTGVLPGEAVVLTPSTGLIGFPTQTDKGISVRCLLNPQIRVAGLIKLDSQLVQEAQIAADKKASTSSSTKAAATVDNHIATDGVYRVLVTEYSGDTRGNDWYADLTCLAADASAPAGEEVSAE